MNFHQFIMNNVIGIVSLAERERKGKKQGLGWGLGRRETGKRPGT